ncbi:MAG TPA: hypothetical protein VNS58_12775 [Puia sp.]|nr:hypothetical protein [Puia sp.]
MLNSRLFEGLDLGRILLKCNTTTLFLQRVYFSAKEFERLEAAIIDLIVKKNCKVKIILTSPNQMGIIKDIVNNCAKYESSEDFATVHISLVITNQIKKLKKIIEELPENKRDYLQVKHHSGNMQAYITGYNDTIISGTYLNNDVAEECFQNMYEGKSTKTYREWLYHFSTNWRKATSI